MAVARVAWETLRETLETPVDVARSVLARDVDRRSRCPLADLGVTDADVLLDRLAARTGNPVGEDADELAGVLDDLEFDEPRLRDGADHEVDTDRPIEKVVESIPRLALV